MMEWMIPQRAVDASV
uniref:Uncharacterized protein n=1 Tax=Rhizophora mucronata TaxID=61149 RepID=A0A2P2QC78_RHIMU